VPLYEYLCKKCKHKFEKIQKFSARHIKKCPECGGVLEQVIHAPSVHFKGSGFYVNDYPGKGSGSSSESGASAEGAKDDSSAKPAVEKTDKSDKSDSKKPEKKASKNK
jgi:putative FmdB family regulatory protein